MRLQELDNEQHPNDTGLLAPLAEQPSFGFHWSRSSSVSSGLVTGQYMRSQDFRMLMAMAGGIGASVGNTGSINFDRVDSSDFSAGKLKMGDRNH